ncbi:Putative sulfite reductase-associated electron transfer protein DsrJ [Candidatus Electronema halotolerans]
MYDSGKIIPGLLIFVLLITFPFWYNNLIGDAGAVPPATNNKIAESHKAFDNMLQSMGMKSFPNGAQHALTTEEMRAKHMDMIKDIHVTAQGYDPAKAGQKPTMSCLTCHGTKEQFCDSCHAHAAVTIPDCWTCHHKK